MEFLRFGGNLAGKYYGCCACCIIQHFNNDPETPASAQLVNGDSGTPVLRNGQAVYVGPTYKDIFLNRIRLGTLSERDMPNHAYLAILTATQCASPVGQKWLKILKEEGFEFIRAFDNSVYTGADPKTSSQSPHTNYMFGLFRNIGKSAVPDPMLPPAYWATLPPAPAQHEIWHSRQTVTMTAEQLIAAGAPVMSFGKKGTVPQDVTASVTKVKASPPVSPFAEAQAGNVAASQPAA